MRGHEKSMNFFHRDLFNLFSGSDIFIGYVALCAW